MKKLNNKSLMAILAAVVFGAFAPAPRALAQDNGSFPPPPSSAGGQYPGAPNGPEPGTPATADADQVAARISFIHGDVSTQRGDSGQTAAATLNTPLMAGDKISTGDASRTEVQLDFANILRLDNNAQANIFALSRSTIQIQLAQGLADYSVLKGYEANAEIDTPNVAVRPLRDGRYRILVTQDGETDITVREGDADISTAQGDTKIHKGDLITIIGNGDQAQYKISRALPDDDWDSWNRDRDNVILNAGSRERTNPYYTGTQDLDPYGVWSEVPDYGSVWIPTVQVGWAPYRAGHWVYEPYWGWTWVSYEPWGWAPYHYGRWFLYGTSWAWWPGPVFPGYRPIWAPAYVSFFGFGRGGFGFSFGFGGGFGFGSVGWLPIGPGDYFHPWWGGYRGRFDAVAVGGFRDGFAPLRAGGFSTVRDVSVNERLRAGVSGVAAGDFARGAGAPRAVTAAEFSGARMMAGNVPVSPTRDSMRASGQAASPRTFTGRGASQQRFFSASAHSASSFQAQAANRGAQPQQGWQRFSTPSGSQPGARGNVYSGNNAYGSAASRPTQPSYRAPLDMRKPVVNPRSYSAPNNGNSGYRGAPPNYGSAPNRGGTPAPTYRSAPTPTYRGGSPGNSAPSYRGGGSPSYRAPSGGGNRGGSRGGGGGGGRHR